MKKREWEGRNRRGGRERRDRKGVVRERKWKIETRTGRRLTTRRVRCK